MNTNPDETKLALWLEDELQGEEFAAFEAWAGSQPEQIAARAEVRRWRELIAAALPAAEEPPYPDFFNHRVARAISAPRPEPAVVVKRRFSWQTLGLPLAACAGMVLAFWLGVKTHSGPSGVDVAGVPEVLPVEPLVYTPQSGVAAERFGSSDAAATVIVLNGVAAIPDATDFSETSSRHETQESDSSSELQPEQNEEPSL
jgi:anti-sigma factor RsiW